MNIGQARDLATEYYNALTPEEHLALFLAMFDELCELEAINVRRASDEEDPDFGKVSVYWSCTGEDLKEDLHAYL